MINNLHSLPPSNIWFVVGLFSVGCGVFCCGGFFVWLVGFFNVPLLAPYFKSELIINRLDTKNSIPIRNMFKGKTWRCISIAQLAYRRYVNGLHFPPWFTDTVQELWMPQDHVSHSGAFLWTIYRISFLNTRKPILPSLNLGMETV